MPETELQGKVRLPMRVLTISAEMRDRSSCGTSAASRTRPLAAPVESYTVKPNSSLRDKVLTALRILN
jgi:hypothetical protein